MPSMFSVEATYGNVKSDPPTRHFKKLNNKDRYYPPTSSENNFDLLSDSSMESIEAEMARVCGEGVENSVQLKNSSASKLSHFHPPKTIPPPDSCGNKKSSSEKRPVSGGLKPSNIQNSDQCNKDINWHLLRLKNESDLQRKMKRLEDHGGAEKRARIEKRFIELFGPDESLVYSPNGNISDKKDKDAIAALTVKHLMPMYKKQKIASKDLFKKLAKHISDQLMEKLSSPDEKDVQSTVQEYFQNGKCVTTETDIC